MKEKHIRNLQLVRPERVLHLRDDCDAYVFDLYVLAHSPLGGRFLRRCLPFELPPGGSRHSLKVAKR